ncbi:MAG: prolipoprotein diacylglyceryl transferase [Deltaproteobacteria bacterium]|nr:prolipoprotein diacylglyceryl transferase [Deltaproteobacteria bacterium]
MSPRLPMVEMVPSFPRYFRIGRHWVSAYKVFLCIGIYMGTLVSAAMAQGSGISPLRMGMGCVACAIVGMVGARIFHLIVSARLYTNGRFWAEAWNPKRGGWSVFGGLAIVPFSFLLAAWLRIPVAVYWDHMIFGIVATAVWGRFGCVGNGCCGGKRTTKWYGVRLHDIRGTRERRIPVQWLEIGWWLLAGAGLLWLWPKALPPGSYALGVLSWYGLGRFWLEPLREEPDLVAGWVRINQVVAALLALGSGGALLFLS